MLYKLGNDVNERKEGDFLHGKMLEKPQITVQSPMTVKKVQAKNKLDDGNEATAKNEEKGNDVTESDGEMERQLRKLAKKASGRYLLVNIIKYVLPGVYTLFCFIFFLIGTFLAQSKQII